MSWAQQYEGLWVEPAVSCMYISLCTRAIQKFNVIFVMCEMGILCIVINEMSSVYYFGRYAILCKAAYTSLKGHSQPTARECK